MLLKLGLVCASVIFFMPASAQTNSPPNANYFLTHPEEWSNPPHIPDFDAKEFVTEFLREAAAGLQIIRFSPEITPAQVERLEEAMKTTQVIPVPFRLCADDLTSNCSPEAAFAAKNYRKLRLVLVDQRDVPNSWKQITRVQRRQLAIHEFAGIAGLEISNHYFTSRIDDDRIYEDFKSRKLLSFYFQQMNNLYQLLPGGPAEDFAGSWGKTTVLRKNRRLRTSQKKELLRGDQFLFDLVVSRNTLTRSQPPPKTIDVMPPELQKDQNFSVHMTDYTHTSRGEAGIRFFWGGIDEVAIQNGELVSLRRKGGYFENEPATYSFSEHWRSRMRRAFAPDHSLTVARKGTRFPGFSCKLLSESQLMCRHVFLEQDYFGFHKVRQYSFYDRVTIKGK